MIPVALAASALGSAVNLLSSVTDAKSSSAATPTQSGTPAATKKNDVVNQADFMQLLIAQLQNQDPLNPLDSANFSAQLAQFSSLQQLTEINQHLADQGSGGTGATRFDAVAFLGKDVDAVSGGVTVAQGKATGLDYTLATNGTVQAQVVDGNGHTVANLVLGPQTAGAHHLDLGAVPNAPTLADGAYTVHVMVGGAPGTEPSAVETHVNGRVTGVDLSGNAPALLIGGARVSLTDVRQLLEPTAAGS